MARILNIIQCANLGGMEKNAALRLKSLKGRGHQLRLVSLNPMGGMAQFLDEDGIPYSGLANKGPFGMANIFPLRKLMRIYSPQALIMTGHSFPAFYALGDHCKGHRLLTLHFHHQGIMPDWQWRLVYNKACATFDKISFVTDYIRQQAVGLCPAVAPKAFILPNIHIMGSLPNPAGKLAARGRLGLKPEELVIGNAGWLIPRKRFDLLLKTAARLNAIIPLKVLVAGDGPLRDELHQLAHSLGIENQVRWLGWQKDLKDFYQSLDLLQFNSDFDALGNVPLEALNYGVPSVSSVLNGGLNEIMGDIKGFEALNTHDEQLLFERCLWLLQHPLEARQMAEQARAHLANKEDLEKNTDHLERLLGLRAEAPEIIRFETKKVKILNIIQCTNLGGMEKCTLTQLKALKTRDHQVELISLNPLGALAPLLKQAGIPAHGLNNNGLFGSGNLLPLKHAIKSLRPDAIMMTGHNYPAFFAVQGFCTGHRLLAMHFHHQKVMPAWQWRMIYKKADAVFDKVSFVTDYIRQQALEIKPELAPKAFLLRNDYFEGTLLNAGECAKARQHFGLSLDEKVVGNAGWFIPRKRFDLFLRLIARLNTRWPVTALVAGDGPLKAKMMALAQDLGIRSKVKWVGWQEDLKLFYSSLDLVLFNSDFDALGNIPLEAINNGVPVVCSVLNGGLGEMLDDQEGFDVLKAHDEDKLMERCIWMLEHPADAKSLALRAKTKLSQKVSADKNTNSLEQLLGLRPGLPEQVSA
jgi:glycosyltransferase involved in cell wall biosynthesis